MRSAYLFVTATAASQCNVVTPLVGYSGNYTADNDGQIDIFVA
jgi:hypothetical protein